MFYQEQVLAKGAKEVEAAGTLTEATDGSSGKVAAGCGKSNANWCVKLTFDHASGDSLGIKPSPWWTGQSSANQWLAFCVPYSCFRHVY